MNTVMVWFLFMMSPTHRADYPTVMVIHPIQFNTEDECNLAASEYLKRVAHPRNRATATASAWCSPAPVTK